MEEDREEGPGMEDEYHWHHDICKECPIREKCDEMEVHLYKVQLNICRDAGGPAPVPEDDLLMIICLGDDDIFVSDEALAQALAEEEEGAQQ